MHERIDQALRKIDPQRLLSVLVEMIDIYSPSGKEKDIQVYLEDRFRTEGFEVTRQEVEEDRFNLLLAMGSQEPLLYLVGHVDTVADWDFEEEGPYEQGGIIRGLGSADMKGGCAAMVETWMALAGAFEPTERPPVGLALVVGEEESGDGSEVFLENIRPPWVIIGEPTSLAVCYSHYGYLEAFLETTGRKSHSSLPELGHNAVESMLKILLHLGRHELFQQEASNLVYSIREMSSSRAGFVVPDRCETWIDLHLRPGMDLKKLKTLIRQRAMEAHDFIPDLNLEVGFESSYSGYDLGNEHFMANQLNRVYHYLGVPYYENIFRSQSDGNLFYQAGSQPVILGPGALETAHTPDEHTSLAEVTSAARIYTALCAGLEHDYKGG
ncbi:M20/M25/M40 family metallo-hydrolase [Desulfonatronospira sp.]|uniref:M20 family metallopeptidase n=1 Tax=Desulfonatronospira sp. TaxID=1962951 RepID=UPI0025BE7B4E|nr:M20/M25/M40 family metallo-hydrolase [Desulfonatronospira sp.]